MFNLRNSTKFQLKFKQQKLRNSTKFLNSELIRTSLSRNSSLGSLNFLSGFKQKTHSRVSSLHKPMPEQLRQQTQRSIGYNNLKNTLKELEEKIGKAKTALKSCKKQTVLKGKDHSLIEEEYSLFEVQSTIMKKNEEVGFDLTQNSTKLLSFEKNESKNEISLSQHKRISNRINSPRHNIKRKNYYVIDVEKLYNGQENQRLRQHLYFSLKVFHSLSSINAHDFPTISENRLYLPQRPQHKHKKTLLLDIDQTILHCQQMPNSQHQYDFILEIQVSESETAIAYISLRPYTLTFLRNMSKIFQIIAFTASHQSYADVVLDEIDPQKEIFSHRLYRGSCQQISQNLYTKDLRIVNRRLQSTVLVDNSPYSYIFQLQNGIPILPYHYGSDRELPELEKYLQKLSKCQDVRQLNKQTFKLHKYTQYEDLQSLQNLYR